VGHEWGPEMALGLQELTQWEAARGPFRRVLLEPQDSQVATGTGQ
jgi:hypothetical protein